MTGAETKALRLSMGLSYAQFARLLGVAKSTIQAWEARGPKPPADILLKLLRDDPRLAERIGRD